MVQAVLFDMDGVITDTESIGYEVMREAAKLQGTEISRAFFASIMGSTKESGVQRFGQVYPQLDCERVYGDFHDLMLERARNRQIKLMKGVTETLDLLEQRGIPCAIASSSPLSIVRAYLEPMGILHRFCAIATGDEVTHSKPAPDIFLLAARKLGKRPEDCLVAEDSGNGLRAGRASGAKVCMVPDQIPFSEELRPFCDYVLGSLLELKEIL